MKPEQLPTVLACGAWLKNSACLLDAGALVWSAAHGDLSHPDACRALETSARSLLRQARQPVRALAHDLHPDFYSTRLAVALAQELGVPAIGVQHHHAHIAAVMAEYSVQEPVLGLALDGVGLGSDGAAWGGELLWVAPHDWRRLGHLWSLALPGGDVAAREPWRMAAAALHALGRGHEIGPRFAPLVGQTAAAMVQQMLERGLNCPATSSTGRWFDAAAGALGLSVRQSHEAQAAMALEQQAQAWLAENAPTLATSCAALPPEGANFPWGGPAGNGGSTLVAAPLFENSANSVAQLDLRPLLAQLLDTPSDAAAVAAAAAWFHLALADALADWVTLAAEQTGARTVCLGGGCFMNSLLASRVSAKLQQRGLRVLMPHAQSCGDAGLALGQAWVAAHAIDRAAHPSSSHRASQPATESLSCA